MLVIKGYAFVPQLAIALQGIRLFSCVNISLDNKHAEFLLLFIDHKLSSRVHLEFRLCAKSLDLSQYLSPGLNIKQRILANIIIQLILFTAIFYGFLQNFLVQLAVMFSRHANNLLVRARVYPQTALWFNAIFGIIGRHLGSQVNSFVVLLNDFAKLNHSLIIIIAIKLVVLNTRQAHFALVSSKSNFH